MIDNILTRFITKVDCEVTYYLNNRSISVEHDALKNGTPLKMKHEFLKIMKQNGK